ncbi:MAG: GNAT family N-acetyltransferase [Myxococcaceae bacterium]|nr:GNAT family N-acetyltransferase [Myxococcaceae bacterium]
MSVRLVHVRPHELAPYRAQLLELERDISYPIDQGRDRFVISHGDAYHPFFSAMGDAHFLLALDEDRLVGCLAGVRKPIVTPHGAVPAAYCADLKLHRDYRGRGIVARLWAKALTLSLGRWSELHWRFAFGAAMRDAKGDVMRAARGLNVMRLASAFARLDLYFVAPERLAALDPTGAPPTPTSPGVNLSPTATGEVVSTAGKKDFVLQSTGRPWPLVHLAQGPSGWGASHAAYLQRAGARLASERASGPVCFGLDPRLGAERAFLASRGLQPGALCTVYGLSTTVRTLGGAWVHLATSEI